MSFDQNKHPHVAAGSPQGGEFARTPRAAGPDTAAMRAHPETARRMANTVGDSPAEQAAAIRKFHADPRQYKPGVYYRAEGGGGGQSGAGKGLYLGQDRRAINNFYNIAGDSPVREYRGQPKFLNLMDYAAYQKFEAAAKKKYGPKADHMREATLAAGYDGIRYYDPEATGEEFVVFNADKVKRVGRQPKSNRDPFGAAVPAPKPDFLTVKAANALVAQGDEATMIDHDFYTFLLSEKASASAKGGKAAAKRPAPKPLSPMAAHVAGQEERKRRAQGEPAAGEQPAKGPVKFTGKGLPQNSIIGEVDLARMNDESGQTPHAERIATFDKMSAEAAAANMKYNNGKTAKQVIDDLVGRGYKPVKAKAGIAAVTHMKHDDGSMVHFQSAVEQAYAHHAHAAHAAKNGTAQKGNPFHAPKGSPQGGQFIDHSHYSTRPGTWDVHKQGIGLHPTLYRAYARDLKNIQQGALSERDAEASVEHHRRMAEAQDDLSTRSAGLHVALGVARQHALHVARRLAQPAYVDRAASDGGFGMGVTKPPFVEPKGSFYHFGQKAYDGNLHPHVPRGPAGGQFAPKGSEHGMPSTDGHPLSNVQPAAPPTASTPEVPVRDTISDSRDAKAQARAAIAARNAQSHQLARNSAHASIIQHHLGLLEQGASDYLKALQRSKGEEFPDAPEVIYDDGLLPADWYAFLLSEKDFDASKHPHIPNGPHGGEFAPKHGARDTVGFHPSKFPVGTKVVHVGTGQTYTVEGPVPGDASQGYLRHAQTGAIEKVSYVDNPNFHRYWIEHVPGMTHDTNSSQRTPSGHWLPARVALHQQILSNALADAPAVPADLQPVIVFTMGGPSSGKGAIADAYEKALRAVVVNPDRVKEQLPEYQESLTHNARDSAEIVHEESGEVADNLIFDAALRKRANIVFDGTGKSPRKYIEKMAEARKRGYKILLRGSWLDPDTAMLRMRSRAERTGRYVPEHVVRGGYAKIYNNWEPFARAADDFELYDNSGTAAKKVWSGSAGHADAVHDPDFVRQFREHYGKR